MGTGSSWTSSWDPAGSVGTAPACPRIPGRDGAVQLVLAGLPLGSSPGPEPCPSCPSTCLGTAWLQPGGQEAEAVSLSGWLSLGPRVLQAEPGASCPHSPPLVAKNRGWAGAPRCGTVLRAGCWALLGRGGCSAPSSPPAFAGRSAATRLLEQTARLWSLKTTIDTLQVRRAWGGVGARGGLGAAGHSPPLPPGLVVLTVPCPPVPPG